MSQVSEMVVAPAQAVSGQHVSSDRTWLPHSGAIMHVHIVVIKFYNAGIYLLLVFSSYMTCVRRIYVKRLAIKLSS